MYNWDRSESQRAFKKIVANTYAMGYGVGKSWYDEVPVVRRLRRLATQLQPKDFKNLANSKTPQVAGLVSKFGDRLKDPAPFNDGELSQIMAELGNDVPLNVSSVRYKGPMLDHVFMGDFFPEPGFRSLPESGYCIENSQRDQQWLDYWLSQTTIDPRDGKEGPVFNQKACDKVMKKAGQRTYLDEQELSLRRRMREEIEIADPITAGKPIRAPKKRIMVDERHTFVDGHLVVDFIGEESEYLGRLWYPWETYGKYIYSEMILIPDLLGGIGQSTLRVTRWLMQLRNARLNQTTDFINNKLLPIVLQRRGGDQTAYDLVRTEWMRVVQVDNPNDFGPFQDPNFPAEAWQDQAQLAQQMQSADPVISDYAPGSDENPQAGKFATTAKLQAESSDSITADSLDNIGLFIRDVVENWLAMDQQAMDEPVNVPRKYFERVDAISLRGTGQNAKDIKVDPMDMQEDYEILPEQGSTLASDDEFRVKALQGLVILGGQHPDIINMRNVITQLVRATPGVDPEQVIMPPPPPQPPVPPVKMNISVSGKWEELPPDVQASILQHEGLPTAGAHAIGVGKMLDHVRKAADKASELEAPVDHTLQKTDAKPNGKPKPGKPA